jgi:hypothetical protein
VNIFDEIMIYLLVDGESRHGWWLLYFVTPSLLLLQIVLSARISALISDEKIRSNTLA